MTATEPASHGRVGEIAVCVQRRLESLYALEPEPPVTDYLMPLDEARRFPGGGSRTLVAQQGDEVSVGVVLDASVGAGLERADPRERIDGSNLGPFTTLTEEVSHFLYVLFRARSDRPVTQLELELQGEVDKYLMALFFFGLREEGALSERLRQTLFARYELVAGTVGRELGALPRGLAARKPLLRLARVALPEASKPRGAVPRDAPLLAARTARKARDDRRALSVGGPACGGSEAAA